MYFFFVFDLVLAVTKVTRAQLRGFSTYMLAEMWSEDLEKGTTRGILLSWYAVKDASINALL